MNNLTSSQAISNGLQAFATLGEYLAEDDWHPQQIEGKLIYRMGFVGNNGQITCYAQVREELQQFLFYAMAPVKVPEKARLAVAEFIARANYGIRIGNFEIDFSDGEVRYKSSLDFEGAILSPALIKNTIYPAVQTMDRYLPGMMTVIYGGQSAEAAIAEVEGE